MSINRRLLCFGFVSLLLTSYILLSAFAVVFVQPLPFIHAIVHAQSSPTINQIISTTHSKVLYSFPGASAEVSSQPRMLKIPKTQTKLNLTKGLERQGQYFTRPDDGHYLLLANRSTGKLADMVVYVTQNWRTISDTGTILVGDNIFISTNTNQEHTFRISEKVALTNEQLYVPADLDKLGLIFIVESGDHRSLHIFRGSLLQSREVQ